MFITTTRVIHRRIATLTLGVILLGSLLVGSSAAVRAAAPAGGPIRVFVTPNLTGTGGADPIVITGAIGDFGTTINIDKNGKTDPNGNYGKVTLKKGTVEVNLALLNAATNQMQPTMSMATCSAFASVTAPISLVNGTGLYAGIGGTVKITEAFAFILPTYTSGAKKGQCNSSNSAQPIARYGSITGSGMVRFS